jgi:hypothetical protein
MKNIFFSVAIFAFIVSSCKPESGNNSDKHVHEDGTEHDNHSEGKPKQEVFVVDVDSSAKGTDSLPHEHDTEHSHDHGHKHKH